MSRADFLEIRELMQEKMEGERKLPEITVEFDADTQVIKDQHTYNIIGRIPGTCSDSMILLSAHYDSSLWLISTRTSFPFTSIS